LWKKVEFIAMNRQAFRGQHDQSMDPKGRISLPVKFREVLQARCDAGLVIAKHLDGCLMAYPVDEWVIKENELKQMPTGSNEMRKLKRFFITSAAECSMDRQGRILIPPTLKQHARLEKSIVLAGSIDHFEIWDRDAYYEQQGTLDDSEELRAIYDRLGF
jgi:MraZ protein